MSEDEAATLAATPIPTDGLKSRRYWAGCIGFALVLTFIVAAFIHSGTKIKADQYLSEQYAFYMLCADLAFFLMVLGLLSFKDLLEVAKLKYLGLKAPPK